jgi:flavin reductase (DIM6/NTAB) family NADH-FMN oxidoreductase RutF
LIVDPTELPKKDAYRLLLSTIVPRPIAFVSTVSSEGELNLAPFSFFNGISSSPPLVSIAVANRKGQMKDTARNAVETNELVLNVVTEKIMQGMNKTSGSYDSNVNEFEVAGLTPAPSQVVKPPRVAESPVNLECRLDRWISVADDSVTLLLARVLLIHVQEELWDDSGLVAVEKLHPVGRLGGNAYCRVRDVFEMERPRSPSR